MPALPKPQKLSEQGWLDFLKQAIAARDWGSAGLAIDTLRLKCKWNYTRFTSEIPDFEEVAQEVDDHESGCDCEE